MLTTAHPLASEKRTPKEPGPAPRGLACRMLPLHSSWQAGDAPNLWAPGGLPTEGPGQSMSQLWGNCLFWSTSVSPRCHGGNSNQTPNNDNGFYTALQAAKTLSVFPLAILSATLPGRQADRSFRWLAESSSSLNVTWSLS